jgi:hypothetical protein
MLLYAASGGDVARLREGAAHGLESGAMRGQRTNTLLESTPRCAKDPDLGWNLDVRLAPESPVLGIQGDLQLN